MAIQYSGVNIFSLSITLANSSLFSARLILSDDVPYILTPAEASWLAIFNGVCPPNCTNTPSGFSKLIIFIISSNVIGSK